MPDVPVYLGNFTSNKLSDFGKSHFERMNINVVEDLVFPHVDTQTYEGESYAPNGGDYYVFSGFLRNFTKSYFAKRLLDQYDFLLYIDVDAVVLKPFEFNFDPTAPVALIEPIPTWIIEFIARFTDDQFPKDLFLNWVDVVNKHNMDIFDIDYMSEDVCREHASDVIVTERIKQSSLQLLQQPFGCCYPLAEPVQDHSAFHYDSFGTPGTMYLLEQSHPALYKKFMMYIKHVLKEDLKNDRGHWEAVRAGHR